MQNSGLVLRKAEWNDAGDIARLNNSHLTLDSTQGFLITPVKADEFAKYITDHPDSVSVAEAPNGVLAGFLQLSGSVGNDVIQQLDWHSPKSKSIFENNETLYIEKIVVKHDFKRQNIGTLLYKSVFHQHPECLFYSFVVRKPFTNSASLVFHKKLGFIETAIFRTEEFLGIKYYESIMLMKPSH